MVTDEMAMRIAVFRFGVIADFVSGSNFSYGEKMRLLREKSERKWDIPFSNRTHVAASTMLQWVNRYVEAGGGLEALLPKTRLDRDSYRKLDPSLRMAIRELKREDPGYTVPVIIKKLKHSKIIAPAEDLNLATIYRFIKKEGLSAPSTAVVDRRRFEAEYPNGIWQCDVLHGPQVKVENSRLQKSYLSAIIDDHSRLIVHAEFFLNENLIVLKECLRQAIMKRGIPQKFYVDNGACYRAGNLEQICAQLGVVLTHSRPYTPEGRGKVERWFRYVRQDFLPMHAHKPLPLKELNERLEEWVDDYNDKTHSSTGMSPYDRFKQKLECVRPAPDRLTDYFRLVEFRRVKKDRSIQIDNRLFEVPVGLIDKKIEARFHHDDPHNIEIFFENRSFGNATILDAAVNARIGRDFGPSRLEQSDRPKSAKEDPRIIATGQLFSGHGGQHDESI
jgi:putative transposase